MCGLQEGYEPFCVNMTRSVTFWYTKELSIFENNDDLAGTKIDVTRMPAGADNPPSLKISHNTYEQEEKADWEFMRLCLPVTCSDRFITEQEKARRWQEIQMRQQPRGVAPPRRRGGEVASPEAVTSPQPPASFDDEMLELINEYFYGVRIFPGQDLDGTYVGWVSLLLLVWLLLLLLLLPPSGDNPVPPAHGRFQPRLCALVHRPEVRQLWRDC